MLVARSQTLSSDRDRAEPAVFTEETPTLVPEGLCFLLSKDGGRGPPALRELPASERFSGPPKSSPVGGQWRALPSRKHRPRAARLRDGKNKGLPVPSPGEKPPV